MQPTPEDKEILHRAIERINLALGGIPTHIGASALISLFIIKALQNNVPLESLIEDIERMWNHYKQQLKDKNNENN